MKTVERTCELHGPEGQNGKPRQELIGPISTHLQDEPDYMALIQLRPGESSVYARIFGCIPAEESDEEFAAAVEAMR